MTRGEWIQYARGRALQLVERDRLLEACVVMNRLLLQNPDTAKDPRIEAAPIFELETPNVTKWLNGFQ